MRVLFENDETLQDRVVYGRKDCKSRQELVAYEMATSSAAVFVIGNLKATPIPDDDETPQA